MEQVFLEIREIILDMIKKAERYFNTSGPNIPDEHYTLTRKNLIQKGTDLVNRRRYFTIWAPRQTGKSTYFRMLAKELETMGFQVLHINVENFTLLFTEEKQPYKINDEKIKFLHSHGLIKKHKPGD